MARHLSAALPLSFCGPSALPFRAALPLQPCPSPPSARPAAVGEV